VMWRSADRSFEMGRIIGKVELVLADSPKRQQPQTQNRQDTRESTHTASN